jgi:hypothetical protein
MGQFSGSAQDLLISFDGGATFKTLVCTRTVSVNTSSESSKEVTNCGPITTIGDAEFSFDFDAICEVSPTVAQCTYGDLLEAKVNKTELVAELSSPLVTGSSTGAAYHHECNAYVTELTLNGGAGENFVSFSGTIESTGTVDITA